MNDYKWGTPELYSWISYAVVPLQGILYKPEGFDETKALTRKTQSLRDGGFGVVLKGVYCLDWVNFKRQEGQYMMGVYDKKYLKDTLLGKKEVIKRIQAYWIKNAKYAHELIKEIDE